jgi:L-lactate dehydrogenase complex protein LldG
MGAAMDARERILARLRSARASARLPVSTAHPAAGDVVAAPAHAGTEQLLTRFLVEAAALRVECHVEETADAVRARLREVLQGNDVAMWEPSHLPYEAATVARARASAADAPIGLTGCDAAIAETASLVTFSAPGRPRTVSLLPPVHVALVRREQLCFSMREVLSRYREQFEHAASCTIITGPSRTADIELTLTLGIHGPARVVVIIGP